MRDPVVAQAVITAGLFLAALLPLLVAVYALRRLPEQRPVDELLGDTLLQSLLTNVASPGSQAPLISLPDQAAPPLGISEAHGSTDGNSLDA